MLSRKMLAHQGLSAAPVKLPAEDFRLTMGAFWTPDGGSGLTPDPLKVRSGIVWGQAPPGVPAACSVITGSGQVTVKPGRVVIQGAASNQGHYVGVIDADQVRTVAAAKVGAGLPAAGQYKTGRVLIRVYDQLYDGLGLDGWDVELHLGSAAATPAAAQLPAMPSNALQLRTFTVDSTGAVTLTGVPTYTVPNGSSMPVYSTGGAPVLPWEGCRVWEVDTLLEKRWNAWQWEIIGHRGPGHLVPRLSMFLDNALPPNNGDTLIHYLDIRKYGVIDSICSYDVNAGVLTFNARCRVRMEAMAFSDAAVARYSLFKLMLSEPVDLHLSSMEDRRMNQGPINFPGGGGMTQTVSIGAMDVSPGDQVRAYILSNTYDASVVNYDFWWNITLVN